MEYGGFESIWGILLFLVFAVLVGYVVFSTYRFLHRR